MHECFLLLYAGRHSRPGESGFTDNVVKLTRAIGEEALPNVTKLLEGLTVFAEKLYSAVAKSKKAALTGGVPSDEGGQRQPGKEA